MALTDIDTVDSEWGYAIQGGVKFNLPFLAAGDQLWLQAAFASGAPGYTHAAPFTTARAGTFRLNATEAVIDPLTGDVEKTDSWSVSGKFLHYWLPNLRSNFFGAYSELDYSAVGSRVLLRSGRPELRRQLGLLGSPDHRSGRQPDLVAGEGPRHRCRGRLPEV